MIQGQGPSTLPPTHTHARTTPGRMQSHIPSRALTSSTASSSHGSAQAPLPCSGAGAAARAVRTAHTLRVLSAAPVMRSSWPGGMWRATARMSTMSTERVRKPTEGGGSNQEGAKRKHKTQTQTHDVNPKHNTLQVSQCQAGPCCPAARRRAHLRCVCVCMCVCVCDCVCER